MRKKNTSYYRLVIQRVPKMIQIFDLGQLPSLADAQLTSYQQQVDVQSSFEEQVKTAIALYGRVSKKGDAAFDVVRQQLDMMCSGARRCMYCEDSVADEIEHVRPKFHYPDYCFKWENFIYACGACNRPKWNKYAVFDSQTNTFYRLPYKKGKYVRPIPGTPVLINPRIDDPMKFCMLDLLHTFMFALMPDLPSRDEERAKYTFFEILNLNDREYLRKARESSFYAYRNAVIAYAEASSNSDATEMQKQERAIRIGQHKAVWFELKRYFSNGIWKRHDSLIHKALENNSKLIQI
ncbi:MAG: hypothetical protein ACOY5B_08365 [Spirochaetota bacterium]